MTRQEKIKRFLVFCEPCAYKKIYLSDKPDGLTEIKTSPIPRHIPTLKNPNHKMLPIDIDQLTSEGWKQVDGDGKTSLIFEKSGTTKMLVPHQNGWCECALNLSVHKQNTKVKCPKCGRGVVVKKLPDVYSNSYDEIDRREQAAKEAQEKKKRIEDGTPPKLKPPEFLG